MEGKNGHFVNFFQKKNLVTVLAYFFAIHNLKKTIDG